MNSQNVEKAKKILIPSFLTIGGLWISYVGYFTIPIIYGFWKFARFKPTVQMLEKAWEGFEYDPQNNTSIQVNQVLKRSSTLYREIMPQFTLLSKKLRQTDKLEQQNEFIQSVKQEIDQKINQSRMCAMHFLQYKNYSFEDFFQKTYLQPDDQQILQLTAQYDIQLFLYYDHDRYLHKLPTINQFIAYLKKIMPLISENKPQIDRLRHLIMQNGLILNSIKPDIREEVQKLCLDYQQLCSKQYICQIQELNSIKSLQPNKYKFIYFLVSQIIDINK
ncbi:hypothetical protein pb186bvf_003937 [Paramecium bursaria]